MESVFVLAAGPVDLTVTFLSPVEVYITIITVLGYLTTFIQPDDLIKQSLPLSYMSVSAAANDGGTHSVQVYTDISAEWVTGDNSLTANWSTTTNNNLIIHQVQLESQGIFSEVSDHIQRTSSG